jgi:hypothetical protein
VFMLHSRFTVCEDACAHEDVLCAHGEARYSTHT